MKWLKHYVSACLLCVLCLLFHGIGGFVYAQEGEGCTGRIFIANWAPKPGQDGPQLSSITLHYEYIFNGDQVTKRYKLKWFLGDYMVIDGKRYPRSAVDPKLFDQIRIKNVSFKAKVMSEGKEVTKITIDYPDIVPPSGGESGWHITGSADWNTVFENRSLQESKRICDHGMKMKDPQILNISFTGLKELLEDDPEEELKVDPTPTNGGSGGSSKFKKSTKKRKRTAVGAYIRTIDIDIKTGNISRFKDGGWHLNGRFGLNYLRYPINVNTIDKGKTIPDSVSTLAFGWGAGLRGGVELWPVFSKRYGVGGFANSTFGYSPESSLTSFTNLGLRGFIGTNPFFGLYEIGIGYRSLSYHKEEGSTSIEQNTNYAVSHLGLGIRIWMGDDNKPVLMDIGINFEQPSVATKIKRFNIFHVKLWLHNNITAAFEFSQDYWAPGLIRYRVRSNYQPTGLYFGLHFSKSFDFFGRPYKLRRKAI